MYSERRRVLDGRALKKQVIGYGELTMGEIVEAYESDLPPEEWDLAQLVGKVKEFIYLLEDLTPIRSRAWVWRNSRLSFRSNYVMPTTSKKLRLAASGAHAGG